MMKKLKEFASLAIVLIDVLANVFGIITSLNFSKRIGIAIIIITIVFFLIWITVIIYNFFKSSKAISIYKREYIEKNTEAIAIFHSIVHQLRDSSSNISIQKINTVETLDNYFKQLEIGICTSVESMYRQIWDKETCTCI